MLTRKDVPFSWGVEEELSFLSIRSKIASAPILAHYHQNVPNSVSADASDFSLGAVLEPLIDGELRPVDYFSCHLKPAEIRNTTMEKESMAVVKAILHWHYELIEIEFVVFTDNAAVSMVMTQLDPGARIFCWGSKVSEYSFQLNHPTRRSNVVADYLSRLPVPSLLVAPRSRQKEVTFDRSFEILKEYLQ
mmetsp:Transcript_24561/g.61345  ORF Transcript_24561/g.61345 Transcript_24561/m.61345 type:complete len:191 (-) Transcript_24561:1742-2314(-)